MNGKDLSRILQIGTLLTSEQDHNRLLEAILQNVMELADCDAGTLYLLDNGFLRFRIMCNHTLNIYEGGNGVWPDIPPVPMDQENVCALSLLENRTVRVDDVITEGFMGPVRYDAMTGYHTRTMLVVPMVGREGEKIGVLQLINARGRAGEAIPFPREMAPVLESVASQAAVTIQNIRYVEQIRELFSSFVRAMTAAIEERTPYNAMHTRHMAAYAKRWIRFLNRRERQAAGKDRFDPVQTEELLMSIWLHDIGKLVTPLEVMNKEKRLYPIQKERVWARLDRIGLLGQIRFLKGDISEVELSALDADLCQARQLIERADSAGALSQELAERLEALHGRSYLEEDGSLQPWLTDEETRLLTISKGNLSEQERRIMEGHVTATDKLLSQIPFPKELSHVRQWAAWHHELLNGSGYPNGLSGEDIPYEVRMITILDVFDALVADDRPYKPGMPVERAVNILQSMATEEGKLDRDLTTSFIESRCWEEEGE